MTESQLLFADKTAKLETSIIYENKVTVEINGWLCKVGDSDFKHKNKEQSIFLG